MNNVLMPENYHFGDFLPFTLGIEHFLIIGMIIAWKKNDKGFFRDWVPFIILIMTYNMMRGIADNLNHVNVRPVYDLELTLFGWMFGGQIPAFWAQEHQNNILLIIFSFFYAAHPFSPLVLGLIMYYRDKDRATFKEFSNAFLLTSYFALITFALYPVAPPWYIWNSGNGLRFDQPQQKTGIRESAANLLSFDNYFKTNIFGEFYKTFNANPYAAVPSLHSAYSFFTAYYVIKKYGRKFYPIIIYPIIIWIAAVYLNHHFIVDLIFGVIYSYVAIRIVRYLQNRNKIVLIEEIETTKTEDSIEEKPNYPDKTNGSETPQLAIEQKTNEEIS